MKRLIPIVLLLGTLILPGSADEGFEIFKDADVYGEIRPRFENFDDGNNALKTAQALTVRGTLGLEVKKLLQLKGLGAYGEFNAVADAAPQAHGKPADINSSFAQIDDVQDNRFSQGYITYKISQTRLLLGRESLSLDNQRFIGRYDWQQSFQSFDLFSIKDRSFQKSEIFFAYMYGVNTPDARQSRDMDSFLLNLSYQVAKPMKLTLYSYLLDALSDTYGLIASGRFEDDSMIMNYHLEAAKQLQPTINTALNEHVNSFYYNLDFSVNLKGLLGGMDYEVLGAGNSDSDASFQTPFASKHRFNGYADMFNVTPSGGMSDLNFHLGFSFEKYGTFKGFYHFFTADSPMLLADGSGAKSTNLGDEFDLLYHKKSSFVKGSSFMAKLAYYRKGSVLGYNSDRTKFWLQFEYKFKL